MTGFQRTGQISHKGLLCLWWLLCGPFVLASDAPAEPPSLFAYHEIEHDGLVLSGTVKFTNRVVQCLDLLAQKDPNEYRFVKRYIGVIKQHKSSGMVADATPPRYELSSTTAFYSLTWCASSIAHDAYHSYLYQRHKPADGSITPAKYWSGFEAEREAITHQRFVARHLGASQHEQNYLRDLKGTHADRDGDGVISIEDDRNRDW